MSPRARLVALLALSSPACHHGGPRQPAPVVDLDGVAPLSFALDGAPRLDELSLLQDPDGYRTDIRAWARSPSATQVRGVDLVIIGLRGPGDYPFGFAWDRGATRATVATSDDTPCMTTGSDHAAGTVRIIAGPADGKLVPGARLEGRFEIRCFPRADPALGAETVFTGRFIMTAPARPPAHE